MCLKYLVLYVHMSLTAKYRPKTIAQLIGQQQVSTLTSAIAQSRLHPAYLFTGTRGVGKTSAARALARSLNCETGITLEPCGVCKSCKTLDSGNNTDVWEIDCATHNGVDFARDLTSKSQYAPFGSYRIYILDEAHNLTKQANEALLKTIEEPSAKTIFILITTEPQKMLKTVESRCQRLAFNLVDEGELLNHLHAIAATEDLKLSPGVVEAIAHLSGGIVRDAVTLLDQISLNIGASVADVYTLMGKPDVVKIIEIVTAIASGDIVGMYRELKTITQSGVDPLACLGEIANFIRNGLICKQGGSAAARLMTCDYATFKNAGGWARSYSVDSLVSVLVLLRRAEIDFSATKYPQRFLEGTLLEVMQVFKSSSKVRSLN